MAGFLTSSELAQMRVTASAMLPSSCTVQTSSLVSDGMGGQTETWSNAYLNVPCKLDVTPSMATFPTQGDQYQVHSAWVLSLAFDQPIAPGNRIILGGDTFEVLSVGDDASYRTLRRAELRRVD